MFEVCSVCSLTLSRTMSKHHVTCHNLTCTTTDLSLPRLRPEQSSLRDLSRSSRRRLTDWKVRNVLSKPKKKFLR